MKHWLRAIALALLLSTDVSAQSSIDGIGPKIDAIAAKVDQILKALLGGTPPPPPPPPALCATPNSGGKFILGDKAKVKVGTGGWQVRATPDINAIAVPPPLAEGAENIVACTQKVGVDQWIQLGALWAREACCDKPGVIVILPPPPPDVPVEPPPTDATYYVSPVGDDANDGSFAKPFKTLMFAIPKLKAGQVLVVRGGEYETNEMMANGQSYIPSGESWDKPVQIRAYPGEAPKFRRFLPAGYDEAAVMKSAHMPTKAECDAFMAARGQPNYSFPKDCFTGSGSDPTGLYIQLNTPNPLAFGSSVIKLQRTPTPGSLQYIIFDGIDIDAMGLVGNAVSFPESPNCSNWQTDTCSGKHIRFIRSRIRNSIASGFSQPGVGDGQQITSDIQVIASKVGPVGIPFDPNRSAYGSLIPFFHTFYLHSCGNTVIDTELFGAAGTGISLDCDKNVIRGNYIHDNNAHGIYISGGHNWTVEYNISCDNGGAQITLYGGHGHSIRHNTLCQTIPSIAAYGLLFNTNASDSIVENNLIVGAPIGIYNLSQVTPRITVSKNLIWGATPGREVYNPSGVVALLESGTVIADPKLDSNLAPQAGSPAFKTATDGTNIGAKQ